MPSIQVIGVYTVSFRDRLFSQAYKKQYANITLSFLDRRMVKKRLREELSSIVLIEVIVDNYDKHYNISDFGQEESDQAPYSEVYLSDDGTKIISEGFEVPEAERLRLCFFMIKANN
ncbi:MAG: hypothetical protein ACE14V_16255 [bacterium]